MAIKYIELDNITKVYYDVEFNLKELISLTIYKLVVFQLLLSCCLLKENQIQ